MPCKRMGLSRNTVTKPLSLCGFGLIKFPNLTLEIDLENNEWRGFERSDDFL